MTTQKQNYGEKANKLSSELWEWQTYCVEILTPANSRIIFSVSFIRFLSEKGRSRSKKCSGR